MRKIGRTRRAVSALLAVALSTTLVPVVAFADEQTDAQAQQELPLASEQGDITVRDMGENGEQQQVYGTHPVLRMMTTDDVGRTAEEPAVINVRVPLYVTFGDANGYDVSKPQQMIESTGTFENKGPDFARLERVECTETSGAETLLDNPENVKTFGIYNGYTELEFGYASDADKVAEADQIANTFDLDPNTKREFTFRLHLGDRGVSVKHETADNGQTVQPLAKIKYTFRAIKEGYATLSSNFYLYDKSLKLRYSLAEVKDHANNIRSLGSSCKEWIRYSEYIAADASTSGDALQSCNNDRYECVVKVDGKDVRLRVVDIRSGSAADGGGLTFQTVGGVTTSPDYFKIEGSISTATTWDSTPLNTELISFAEKLPTELQNAAVTRNIVEQTNNVSYSSGGCASVSTKQKKWWAMSVHEVYSDNNSKANSRTKINYKDLPTLEFYRQILGDVGGITPKMEAIRTTPNIVDSSYNTNLCFRDSYWETWNDGSTRMVYFVDMDSGGIWAYRNGSAPLNFTL